MQNFYSAADAGNVNDLVRKAIFYKKNPTEIAGMAKGKTMLLLFFNSSLRTRLSTEVAAQQLGMNVICMDMSSSWKWELEDGVTMKFDTAEHIKDAARVISSFVDVVAIRSFPSLTDRERDYNDILLKTFIKYAEIPVVNMESSILHPLQSLADMITIEELKKTAKPKIVCSWAPHPKALPQAVTNSFLEWANAAGHQVTVTHPEGYELADRFMQGHRIEYDQHKAFDEADFVYVKNWSSYKTYGQKLTENPDWRIDEAKMSLTNEGRFMHCMPIRRNVIATDGVLDHPNSAMIHQAGNRLHSARVVLAEIMHKL